VYIELDLIFEPSATYVLDFEKRKVPKLKLQGLKNIKIKAQTHTPQELNKRNTITKCGSSSLVLFQWT
jgi:hypothetical protein